MKEGWVFRKRKRAEIKKKKQSQAKKMKKTFRRLRSRPLQRGRRLSNAESLLQEVADVGEGEVDLFQTTEKDLQKTAKTRKKLLRFESFKTKLIPVHRCITSNQNAVEAVVTVPTQEAREVKEGVEVEVSRICAFG